VHVWQLQEKELEPQRAEDVTEQVLQTVTGLPITVLNPTQQAPFPIHKKPELHRLYEPQDAQSVTVQVFA
jgi:hypothetical protein